MVVALGTAGAVLAATPAIAGINSHDCYRISGGVKDTSSFTNNSGTWWWQADLVEVKVAHRRLDGSVILSTGWLDQGARKPGATVSFTDTRIGSFPSGTYAQVFWRTNGPYTYQNFGSSNTC